MSATQEHLYLRVAVNERDTYKGKHLYDFLMDYLQSHGIVGATVRRSIDGYGASGILHSERSVDATSSFTMVIESVDDADRILPLLDEIRHMIQSGLITVEPITIHTLCV